MATRFRPLADGEFEDFYALDAYCFPQQYARSRYDARMLNELRRLDVAGRVVAQMQLMPFEIETGRGTLAAGGIGGVAVAGEARGQGYGDALLRAACAEMRERGMALAILYPFQYPYYLRKGWVIAGERRVLTPTPAQLRGAAPRSGTFSPAGPDDIGELDRIFRTALRGRYGPLRRDIWWWQHDVLTRWDGSPFHARIWRDDAGNGRAYLVYRFTDDEGKSKLFCRDIVALDAVARGQLFNFMADHFAQADVVEFPTPIDAPLNAFLPDAMPTSVKSIYLQRVLSVMTLLEQYPVAKEAKGSLTIEISDDWWPENNGIYRVEMEDGRCTAHRSTADADLVCSSGTLAQLLSRFVRPRSAQSFGILEVQNRAALALLEEATAGLPPYTSDYF